MTLKIIEYDHSFEAEALKLMADVNAEFTLFVTQSKKLLNTINR